jgi:hypothetical protein
MPQDGYGRDWEGVTGNCKRQTDRDDELDAGASERGTGRPGEEGRKHLVQGESDERQAGEWRAGGRWEEGRKKWGVRR